MWFFSRWVSFYNLINKFKCWEIYRVMRVLGIVGGKGVVIIVFRETLILLMLCIFGDLVIFFLVG